MSHCRHFSEFRKFSVLKIIGYAVGGVAVAVILGFLFGYFVMLLWNWLMPALFGLPVVNFWQAVGIIVLGKLIFGGGHHGHNHHDHKTKLKMHLRKEKEENCDDYEEFWQKEGKQAFERFVNRKTQEKTPGKETEN